MESQEIDFFFCVCVCVGGGGGGGGGQRYSENITMPMHCASAGTRSIGYGSITRREGVGDDEKIIHPHCEQRLK